MCLWVNVHTSCQALNLTTIIFFIIDFISLQILQSHYDNYYWMNPNKVSQSRNKCTINTYPIILCLNVKNGASKNKFNTTCLTMWTLIRGPSNTLFASMYSYLTSVSNTCFRSSTLPSSASELRSRQHKALYWNDRSSNLRSPDFSLRNSTASETQKQIWQFTCIV